MGFHLMHINTLQMVSFELFPHKFNLSAIFGLRNLHFCCCGVHGEFLNDDNVNYMAVVGFHAATFIQFLIEMTNHKVTRINTSRLLINMSCLETAFTVKNFVDKSYYLVKHFLDFPLLGVQNCLKLAI